MKLTLLGTGTPESYKRRASSSYLIDIGDETLMFDCGGGAVDRILQADRLPVEVDRLFFSHLHSDHMMDYARLVHARWDEGAPELPVKGPAPIATISERYFAKDGPLFADLTARTESIPSQEIWKERGGTLPRPWPSPIVSEQVPGYEDKGDGWALTSVEVPHAQPYLDSMGYRIDADGAAIVYSGDAGPCDGLTELAKGADILIHMCFNLSQEARTPEWLRGSSGHLEVAKTAQNAGVRTVILTHLRPHMDKPGIHEQMLREMAEIYSGKVIVGEDLMTFEL